MKNKRKILLITPVLELYTQAIILFKSVQKKKKTKRRKLREFKDEIFSLITNIISYAHGKILFQTPKSILTSAETWKIHEWVR